jgi:uncharacterized protein (TIGR03437 family)
VEYTINTSPPGLQALVDGVAVSTPASFNWLPGTQHVVILEQTQSGPTGTQYRGTGVQNITVPCGPARQTVTMPYVTQYLLTLAPTVGGAISVGTNSPAGGFLDAGTQESLTETAYPGYTFAGWTGACSGQGSCQVTLNGPLTVGANFTPSGGGPAPEINAGGIVTASAFGAQSTIAPGTWIEIYGSNLSPLTAQWFGKNIAPGSLSGVEVTIGGNPAAAVSYVSAGQVNAQVPAGIAPGTAKVVVANGYGTSSAVPVNVAALQPGLYTPGNGYVGAFLNGSPVGSPGYSAAAAGQTITLYGIGFGPVSDNVQPGQPATAPDKLTTPLTISIGGVNATLSYAGLSPGSVGLYQFNVTVPNVSAGNQPVTINLGGTAGTQTLLLTVGQ